jgi:diaminopimelate epimerase
MHTDGREFYKMCGSGNDFVVFDARAVPAGELLVAETICRVCARGTGVGADGVVALEPSSVATIRMVYHNSDGSRASLCGNAALCTTRLAVELGADPAGFTIETDAGVLRARIRDGLPEVDLQPVRDLTPAWGESVRSARGEQWIGFARAGVPHLVVAVDDLSGTDVSGRGRQLRHDPTLLDGANVNFIAPAEGGWRMRTYERGVEAETLACGTGAVACAAVLAARGLSGRETVLVTSSGRSLRVRLDGADAPPALAGEGRIVFRGALGALD